MYATHSTGTRVDTRYYQCTTYEIRRSDCKVVSCKVLGDTMREVRLFLDGFFRRNFPRSAGNWL